MILVTGAAGLSGSIVIREFVRRQQPVRALVRDRTKANWLDQLPTVEVVEGDMLRPETLGAALDGVDRTLMISTSSPQMVDTQCTFIDACKAAGVPHVVKFSGAESGIGFDPANFSFFAMHEEIERYLERSGLAWTHLRPSQFMQVYFREVGTIVADDAFYLPMNDVRLSPVDIEDIAKVAVSVLGGGGHKGMRYDMTGPEALTADDVAAHLSTAVGRTIRYVNITLEQFRERLLAGGAPPGRADALGQLFAERQRHPDSRIYTGTHEAFGIQPTSFAEFARRNAAVFRGEPVPA
jgi:uncharacterized protein YbjT (DUF2867 family)